MVEVKVPADWPFEHIPTWEYDEDGELEVTNYQCQECIHSGTRCRCINHEHVHFYRPFFKYDEFTGSHTICREFKPDYQLFPAGCLEWDALGSFDEWLRLWRKQWHPRRDHEYAPKCALIRANQVKGREHCDDVYYVSYEDFVNCNIMKDDGIHCLDYMHIEISRKSYNGYKWVHEGKGLWIPWQDNKYIKEV